MPKDINTVWYVSLLDLLNRVFVNGLWFFLLFMDRYRQLVLLLLNLDLLPCSKT